ncbi:hypothetical protein ACD578_26480 (plasmid) [Microvirga sp. RSM25]|uniref:hypothetical protein n=1 Tax=Microvirga sp. RSM25 TaxID=3273802 RepID=UPI00384D07A1
MIIVIDNAVATVKTVLSHVAEPAEGWHRSYNLSRRDLEEMITERGISVDHATIHDL